MMDKAVIVFVKNLQMGKVKTRLAATLGNDEALRIYKFLIDHTYKTVSRVSANTFVFYSTLIEEKDTHLFEKRLQSGPDLGVKMKNAFRHMFDSGYERVVIIGSDCPEITPDIIEQAFDALKGSDVVVGPAVDGGYYLLGMGALHEELFEQVEWSTNSVFETTIKIIRQQGLSYSLLPELRDIDEEQDWQMYQSGFII
ncbi:TIGR04282 family arsenosugar biosynthesis glycosyltransferase [Desertivirga brevis]|uniref:TIGR04282 family arsenosugar biosynthesis glycosyltransferase n=1 Tax=Desertivirga brevis TaxID=2810310 RepID=UPI001A962F94|nr:TIGR04282 family arsenosugar biosynthesis glycosyltransferase [Pedobacter sp. SYSU D00873]